MVDVSSLPFVNATLNSISTLLLIISLWFIKNKNISAHKLSMLSAFGTSVMFLVTYVIYHWFKSGPKMYTGDFSTVYYIVLISHIILAVFIIPLALITLYRGWNMQVKQHRKIAKITYPIWLYVSITGVVIYKMHLISWWYTKMISQVKYASMTNLIAQKEILPELLQSAVNANAIVIPLKKWLRSEKELNKTKTQLAKVRGELGCPGAFEKAAELIVERLSLE